MNKKNIFRIHLLSLFLLASCTTPTTVPVGSSSPTPTISPSTDSSVTPDTTQSPRTQPSSSVSPSISPTPSATASAGTSVNTSTTLSIPSDFLKISYNDYYSAELKWAQMTGAKSYKIYQDGKLIADNLTGSMYNVTNLTPNTNYTFDIVASNDSGISNKSTVNVRTFIPSTNTSNNNTYTPEAINPRNVSLENIIFVDQSSTYGSNNGTTWNNAYTNLQDALARTDLSGKQIWIAKGTYSPATSFVLQAGSNRNISFVIPGGVKVYGGFFGTELSIDSRTAGNTVTLSGDLNKNDSINNYSDNSYHVVKMENHLTNPSTIDTLTISGGYADGSMSDGIGAGLYIQNSSPIINNVIFSKNTSTTLAGGLYANGTTNLTINNSKFNMNKSESGGAITSNNDGYNLNINNSSFTGNISTQAVPTSGGGGAIYVFKGNMNIKSSIFKSNTAVTAGAIYNSTLAIASIIENSTFSLNQATLSSGAIVNSGTLTLNGSNSITGNTALDAGGIGNVGTLIINGSTSITNNTVTNSGGGISNAGSLTINDNVSVSNNTATNLAGGIYNYFQTGTTTTLVINNSAKITRNTAANGGGIYNTANVTLILNGSTSIADNTATANGGGIYNATSAVDINGSTSIANNTSISGGGIFNNAGAINLNNTVSINRNNANTGTNNADYSNKGGGIYNYVGTVNLNDSSSITNNNATGLTPASSGTGGGIFNHSVTTTYNIGSPSYSDATSPGAVDGTNVKDNTLNSNITNYTQIINSGN